MTLTFQPQNHVTSRISRDHSQSLVDHSYLSYAADKQTNKLTAPNILPTSTDRVGVRHVCRRAAESLKEKRLRGEPVTSLSIASATASLGLYDYHDTM